MPFDRLPQVRALLPAPPAPLALPAAPHLALQALGLLLFAAFAIVATTLAFVFIPLAGLVLALAFGWAGFGRLVGSGIAWRHAASPAAGREPLPQTGNASFDAYRDHEMSRLAEERRSFTGFLDRLRSAKDRTEFDAFMDERARANSGGEAAPRDTPPRWPAAGD